MVLKFTTKPNAPLMLDRSFRLLPSYSVLTCSLRTLPVGKVERLCGLGPVCNFLTKNEDGVSLSTLSLLNQHEPLLLERQCWKMEFHSTRPVVMSAVGTGATLSMIVSKYPTIKGINFDLPHVIENAPTCPGVEHVGGDMFASVPKGDAIFMKCYEAVPDNGKMIVADSILPDYPDPSLATKVAGLFDCTLWATNHGRKERTEKEFEALATRFEP
ncbi:hypothetical protein Gotri_008837 [Gossypium trilobum]|uniref:O-methyltransferase C-terminal domain-containing protein n=1 Tax=Gossypium trilobum TaxID=34281 RepID=A0A7J9EKJ5_9ROSI|nr:hypothetical protein [Gossypium trilobum]